MLPRYVSKTNFRIVLIIRRTRSECICKDMYFDIIGMDLYTFKYMLFVDIKTRCCKRRLHIIIKSEV